MILGLFPSLTGYQRALTVAGPVLLFVFAGADRARAIGPADPPHAPSFEHVAALVPWAVAIALMCFVETTAVAGSVRRPDEPPIDNDQELTANGVACVAGAFFQAMPSAGGFSQTAINQRAGARTQLSELVTVVLAIGCALFLAGVLSDLPQATLGCLVMVAVVGLIRPADFVRFWRLSRIEFWVAVVTAAAGLTLGLLAAVAIGVVLTLFLVIVELDLIGLTELEPVRDRDDIEPAGPRTEPVAGLLVLRFDGPLYTANVHSVNRRLVQRVDEVAPAVLIVDATAVVFLPVTVMDQVADLERQLDQRGVELWIAALPPRALATARMMPGWDALEAAGRACTQRPSRPCGPSEHAATHRADAWTLVFPRPLSSMRWGSPSAAEALP